MLFKKIQNRITHFKIKLILFVRDNNNNWNMINLEKLILLGGYNQLIKGYKITLKKVNDKFFWWGTHTNKILLWGYNKKS